MRKRVAGITIALAILLIFTSCGKKEPEVIDETARTKLNEGIKKTEALESKDRTYRVDMTFEMSKEKQTGKISGEIQTDLKDKKKPEMYIKMKQEADVEDAETEMYYKDDYVYMISSGKKMKVKMPYEEVVGTLDASEVTIDTVFLEGVTFTHLTMQENGDDTNYEYIIDPNTEGMIKELKDRFLREILNSYEDSKVIIKNAKGTATTNKQGYMTAQNITMVMDVKIEERWAEVSVTMDLQYKNPGEDVKITAFSNLGSFIELDKALFDQ